MSVADKMSIGRRPFISGLLGAVALAGIAAIEAPRLFPQLFRRRYPATQFDDLLALLPDRENAVRVGAVLVRTGSRMDPRPLAMQLRPRIGGRSLAVVVGEDIARSRLTEVQGWLLPESLAGLCELAAMLETS